MTNFDKFGQIYCNTCKYGYADISNICNEMSECYKCPNYSLSNKNGYIGCHCLEEVDIDTNVCPYYKEN